jgi:mono/diheme cytochrome c family protein
MAALLTLTHRAHGPRGFRRPRRFGVASTALAVLLIASTSAAAQQQGSPQATFGRLTYQLSCAICHGSSGHGDGEMAGALTVPAPDLTQLARRNGGPFPRDRVRAVIEGGSERTEHGGQMPAWGLIFLKDFETVPGAVRDAGALVRQRIDSLVVYLEAIQE